MIHVLATIQLKPKCRTAFLEIFKANVPAVRRETGCIEYRPTVDCDAGLAAQQRDVDTVVIIEKWCDLEALRVHLAAPHMADYRARVKDMVQNVSLKILQDA